MVPQGRGCKAEHIDQSQSINLYATPDMDEQKFLDLYYTAWKLGIKTLYYFRNFTPEEEKISQAAPVCESCSS